MKKILLTAVITLIGLHTTYAQVGIGTETPKTSLQVVGEPAITTTADGVQVPSLSLSQLDAKITAYSNDQDGAIVFIDDVTNTSTTAQTGGIKTVGFYYYDADNQTWKTVGATTATAYSGTLPVENGGTGSSTQNFVDLTTAQTIAGNKTFSNDAIVNGMSIGRGNGNLNSNSIIGADALASNTTGVYNIAFGNEALRYNTSGSDNVAIGSGTLMGNDNGKQNTAIGNNSGVSSVNLINATAIGYNAKVGTSNTIQLGNTNVTNVNTSGTLTANAFLGDGSGLTGVTDANFNLTGAVDGDLLQYDGTAGKWAKVTPDYISNGDTNVGFGTETPDASAQLELQSTTKGFLPPRMTTNNRNDIENPVEGLTIYNTDDVCLNIYVGFGWRNLCAEAGPNDVINPKTGQIWMDRNLGASQVATSSTDYLAYGDLYQWGRGADGHQTIVWNSATESDGEEQNNEINTTSSSTTPGTAYIMGSSNWYTGSNPNNLWQGVDGVNNPCPTGYRVPTQAELIAERETWSSDDAAGAFASPLKLPVAGYRNLTDGSLVNVGTYGDYWGSTVSGTGSRYLYFGSSDAGMSTFSRALGFSVRCLKD